MSMEKACDLYIKYKNGLEYYDEFLECFLSNIKINDLDSLKKDIISSLKIKLKSIDKINKEDDEKRVEIFKNIRNGINSGLYTYYRRLYNDLKHEDKKELKSAIFYYIRDFCFSSMFRYNSNGDLNVPYGGISYDNKDLGKKLNF